MNIINQTHIYYRQVDIDLMIKRLIYKIKQSNILFHKVVGIKNGGLYVSKPISQELNLPHEVVHISRYERNNPFIANINYYPKSGENILLIDDLIDDGATCRLFLEYFGQVEAIGVLFWKKNSKPKPTFYIEEKPNGWIVFPWETNNV